MFTHSPLFQVDSKLNFRKLREVKGIKPNESCAATLLPSDVTAYLLKQVSSFRGQVTNVQIPFFEQLLQVCFER